MEICSRCSSISKNIIRQKSCDLLSVGGYKQKPGLLSYHHTGCISGGIININGFRLVYIGFYGSVHQQQRCTDLLLNHLLGYITNQLPGNIFYNKYMTPLTVDLYIGNSYDNTCPVFVFGNKHCFNIPAVIRFLNNLFNRLILNEKKFIHSLIRQFLSRISRLREYRLVVIYKFTVKPHHGVFT